MTNMTKYTPPIYDEHYIAAKKPDAQASECNDKVVMRFEASIGDRLHRYFWAVTLTEITDDNLWWNTTLKKWEPYQLNPSHGYSTHAPCRTLRAFKRMLRKHPDISGRCCLVNKYSDYDVYA